MLRSFWKNKKGNVAIVFGFALIPVVSLGGAAIDYHMAARQKSWIQGAVDAASLAGAKQVGISSAVEIEAITKSAFDSFKSNFTGRNGITAQLEIEISDDSVLVRAKSQYKTAFMKLLHVDNVEISAYSKSVIGRHHKFDVAMVLDNSGSMSGSKISALRTAAGDLVSLLLNNQAQNSSGEVQIGLVPFTAFVNVGSSNKNADWMDKTAISPIHSEDFEGPANRFDLFNQISGVSWQGCVEARPYPYDVDDTPADISTPATMFVPQFAVDEPDGDNDNGYSFNNSWIDDTPNACMTTPPTPTTKAECEALGGKWKKKKSKCKNYDSGSSDNLPDDSTRWQVAQARLCKYTGNTTYSSGSGISKGPNYGCTVSSILPMTTNETSLTNAISAMGANGYTNIHQGVVWGRRVLSPGEPFTQGRSDNDPLVRQIMVVMTDGKNTYSTTSNPNDSVHFSYGFMSKQRLGTDVNDYSKMLTRMNERTLEACSKAKSEDSILIYTVAFQVSDQATKDMLAACATDSSKAFTSESNSQLIAAFQSIAQDINTLRIAE